MKNRGGKMKILLTGGTGYIGSHTAVELILAGHEVVLLDNLYNSKSEVLDSIEKLAGIKPKFYKIDMLDFGALKQVFAENDFDAVIHFAGYKAVAESVRNPQMYYYNNLVSTMNLLKVMSEAPKKVKKLVFSSSATIYGDPRDKDGNPIKRYTEDLPTGQNIPSPYGKTKYMIEEMLKDSVNADPELSVSILRYFNPVGNHESGLLGEDPNGIPHNMMPVIMNVYRGKQEKLKIFGNDYDTKDGTCMRDYIHVVDLAKGHVKAIEHLNRDGMLDIYNLGSGHATSVDEMVAAFESASNMVLPKEYAPRRSGDLPEVCADPSKANRELGWKTEKTVEDAMKDTLKFINIH